LAARVFGSDAILYGSEGSWSDLFRRPREEQTQASPAGALTTLAIVAPTYVIVFGILAQLKSLPMPAQLAAAAAMSLLLFVVLPLGLARMQGVRLADGFQLHRASPLLFVAALVLGATLWPLAYDSIIGCQQLGIATISRDKLAENRSLFESFIERMHSAPPALLLLALAVIPAIGEELFFRGYLLGALRRRLPAWGAICLTGAVFGLFHASLGGLILIERVISSTLLGLVLGYLCWQSASVFPGMVLHALHNGLLLSLMYIAPTLKAWGWDIEDQRYLPWPFVAATATAAALALALVTWLGRQRTDRAERASRDTSVGPAAPTDVPAS
jgi:ABC-2 type transport system permease protein/sodium transport system permease protein